MADNIKVAIKVRPLIKREIDDNQQSLWRVSDNTIYPIEQTGKDNSVLFTFDNVFGETSQTQDVYDKVAREIVDAAVDGINGTIFAYGQTSSGKTFTMMGDNESQGVIPLAITNIFQTIESRVDRDFLLRVSYIEIYNEKIRDLLDVTNTDLKIHEDLTGQTSVKCTEEVTSTALQVLKLMRKGDLNRSTGETQMNDRSSRSHTIFQIIIESRKHVSEMSEEENCANVSQLNLVDLAGSERASQTGATKLRLREGGIINKSLCTLSLVIRQLSEVQGDTNRFISFRDSKLTRILQTSLGGNTKTGIICAVTPASLEETHSTLMFAMRAKAIKNIPKVNEVMSDATQLKRLTKEMAVLQNELQSRKFLEADMMRMQKQISIMKNQILMGNVDYAPPSKAASQRRKTWAAPRHSSVSSLAPILEGFAQTDFRVDRIHSNSDIAMLRLSNVTDRDDSVLSHRESTSSCPGSITPREFKKNSPPPSEIICLDDTNISEKSPSCSPVHVCYTNPKKPPCVLIRENRHFRKELSELEEITSLEEKDPYEVVELLKQINDLRHSRTLLEDKMQENVERVDTLSKQIETMTEEKHIFEIMKFEIEKKMNKLQCENTDLIFQMDQLKERTQKRETELILCLKEARCEDGNSAPCQNSSYQHFLNMSQGISLVNNSDEEHSITETVACTKNDLIMSIVNPNTVDVIDNKEKSDNQLNKRDVIDDDVVRQINNLKLQIEQKDFDIVKLKADVLELTSHEYLKPSEFTAKEKIENPTNDGSALKLKSEEQDKVINNLQHSLDQLNIRLCNLSKDHDCIKMKFADSEECISHLETEIACLESSVVSKNQFINSLTTKVSSLENIQEDHRNIELLITTSEENVHTNNLEKLQINLDEKLSEINVLNTTVQSLTTQINDVSKEITMKTEQLEERERHIQRLTDTYNNSKTEIAHLQLTFEESNLNKMKEITELNDKIARLNNDLSSAQSAIQTTDSKLEIDHWRVENENLTRQLTFAEDCNRDLLKKRIDSEEVIANKLNEICELNLTIDSLNSEIANLQSEIATNNDSSAEISQLKSDNIGLLEKIRFQQEIITNITKDVSENKQTVDLLNKNISDLQSELQQNLLNSQRELNDLKSENSELVKKMVSTNNCTDDLLRQIVKHEEMIAVKSAELSDMQEKNLSLNSIVSSLQSELENNFEAELELSRLKNENIDLIGKLESVNDCNGDLVKKITQQEEIITTKCNDISELNCSIGLLNDRISSLESDIEKCENALQFEKNESTELKKQINNLNEELQKNRLTVEGLNTEILTTRNIEIQKNILNTLENNKENLHKSRRKSITSPSPIKFKQDTKRLSITKFSSESLSDLPELSDRLSRLDASLKSEVASSGKLKERVSILENSSIEIKTLFQNVQKEIGELNFILSQFQNIVFCDCEKMVSEKAFINWFYEFSHKGFCRHIEKYCFEHSDNEESCHLKSNVQTNICSDNQSSEKYFDDKRFNSNNFSDILNIIQHSLVEASARLNIVGIVHFKNKVSTDSDAINSDEDNLVYLHSLFIEEIEKKINTISLQENKLSIENECLKIEMEEVRIVIGELVKESEELQRKISGQRSDQIVSMAEFSLLTSRLTAMQHYHNNLHTFSASTVTHVHQELYALQLLLQNQITYERDFNDVSFQLLNNKCQSDQSSQIPEEFSQNLDDLSSLTDTTVTCEPQTVSAVDENQPNKVITGYQLNSSCQTDITVSHDVQAASAVDTVHGQINDYNQLMECFKSKCEESTNLTEKLEHHLKLHKTLQDEYDSLSTELMESLQEVDYLKENISCLKNKNDKIVVCSSVQTVMPLQNLFVQTLPCKLSSNSDQSIPVIPDFLVQDEVKSIDSECSNKSVILNNSPEMNLNIKFIEEELKQLSVMSDCECPENREFKNRLNILRMVISDLSKTNLVSINNSFENSHFGILNNLSSTSDNDVTQNIFSKVEDNFNEYNICKKFIEDKLCSESVQYENNLTLIELFNLCFYSVQSKNQYLTENLQKDLVNAEKTVQSLQSEFDLQQSKNLQVIDKMQADLLNAKESVQSLQCEYDSELSKNQCLIEKLQADLLNAEETAQTLKTELDLVQLKNQSVENIQADFLNAEQAVKILQSELDSAKSKNECIVEKLQMDLLKAEETVQTLQSELDSKTQEIAEFKIKIFNSNNDKELVILKEQCENLNKIIINYKNDISCLSDKLEIECSSKENLVEEKNRTISELRGEVAHLESIRIELEGHLATLESEKHKIISLNVQLNVEQTQLNNYIQSLQNQMTSLEATESRLLQTVTSKDEEIVSSKRETVELLDINNSLKEKEKIDFATIESLNQKLKSHIDKINELEKQLIHTENDCKSKNNNFNSIVEENKKYTQEIEALQRSVTLMKSQIIEKSEILTDVQKLNCDLEVATNLAKEQLIAQSEVMNAKLSKLDEENLGLKDKMLSQTEKLEALHTRLAESSQTNANKILKLERDLSEKDSVINSNISNISELTQRINNMNIEMKCKEEKMYTLLSNKECLSVLLNEKDREIENLTFKLRDLNRMQTENASLQQKVSNYELVNEDLKAQLSAAIKIYTENHNKLNAELEIKKQHFEEEERKLLSKNDILQARADDLQAELNLMVKNSPKARNDLKLKRQSVHDMKRNISFDDSSNDRHMDVDPSPENDWSDKYQQLEEHSKIIQTALNEVETKYKKLCEKYQECEKTLHERSDTYNKLLTSYKLLKLRLSESKKAQTVTGTQDATTNTDEDLSMPLMDFCVDKMTHEVVKEKGKLLQKNNEVLMSKNKELRVEIRRLQHSLENNTIHNLLPNKDRTHTEDPNLLEKMKNMETELSALRKWEEVIKELEIKCQDLDNECEMCAKKLRERDEDCINMYKEKKLLEAEVENLKYEIDSRRKYSPSIETQRKRRSMYDANRSISVSSLDSLGNTEDSHPSKIMKEKYTEFQMNFDILKKHNKELLTKVQKLESKKPNMQTIGVQSCFDSNAMSLNMHATSADFRQPTSILPQQSSGVGIVQKQKLSEYMAENQKQKKLIEKLKTICHTRDARNKYLEDCLAKK